MYTFDKCLEFLVLDRECLPVPNIIITIPFIREVFACQTLSR